MDVARKQYTAWCKSHNTQTLQNNRIAINNYPNPIAVFYFQLTIINALFFFLCVSVETFY